MKTITVSLTAGQYAAMELDIIGVEEWVHNAATAKAAAAVAMLPEAEWRAAVAGAASAGIDPADTDAIVIAASAAGLLKTAQERHAIAAAEAAAAAEAEAAAAGLGPLAPYQFRAMLKIAGIETAVDDAIAAIEDPTQKAVAEAKLQYSPAFHRDDPLIAFLAPAVGLTDEQIDALWEQAKAL